jgi:predicted nucleotidyltransferase
MDTLVVRAPARFTLDEVRDRIAPALRAAGAVRAVAFGSYARGTADGFSDLDLAVVLDTDRPRLERPSLLEELYRALPVGLDLLVFTPAEFERGLRRRFGVFERLADEGVTVYART